MGSGDQGVASFGAGRLRIEEARHEATLDGRLLKITPTDWAC